MSNLPADHPLRPYVATEMQARPPDLLRAPQCLSYLALFSEPLAAEREWQQLGALVERCGARLPDTPQNHFSADLGPFRIRWERHTEYLRYTFIAPGASAAAPSFAGERAIDAVPQDWLAALQGQTIVATHALLVPGEEERLDLEALSATSFAGNALAGASLLGGAATVVTDFHIHADGFSRILVFDHGLTPRQAGRLLQTLLELDTYRVLAMLALPVARQMSPVLGQHEAELSAVTTALTQASDTDEAALLERLTRLEALIEGRESRSLFRFDAAAAYYHLVQRRITELREQRLQGLATIQEFVERRLAPAMNTCRAVASRLESLSARVARANELLATRVDITREKQNQALLESMNRRGQAQLLLQQTVEGLSVAAVTYYIVGLLGYLAKGLKAAGYPVDPEILMAAGIPVVAVLVALGLRRTRKRLEHRAH
jgi:uncharacterized membrane-anchored protein